MLGLENLLFTIAILAVSTVVLVSVAEAAIGAAACASVKAAAMSALRSEPGEVVVMVLSTT